MTIPTPVLPHVTRTANGVSSLIQVNETVALSSPDGGRLWIQHGKVYDDSGTVVDPIPAWVWEEYGKMSSDMIKKLGLYRPGEEPVDEPEDLDDISSYNKSQLMHLAKQLEIEFTPKNSKAELIAMIMNARAEAAA